MKQILKSAYNTLASIPPLNELCGFKELLLTVKTDFAQTAIAENDNNLIKITGHFTKYDSLAGAFQTKLIAQILRLTSKEIAELTNTNNPLDQNRHFQALSNYYQSSAFEKKLKTYLPDPTEMPFTDEIIAQLLDSRKNFTMQDVQSIKKALLEKTQDYSCFDKYKITSEIKAPEPS